MDTLVRFIEECFVFRREMFNGGLTAADISRLRGDKQKEKEAKDNQEKEKQDKENANDSMEADDFEKQSRFSSLANLVAGQIRDELLGMETRVLAAFHAQVETVVGRFGFEKKIGDLHKAVSTLKHIVIISIRNNIIIILHIKWRIHFMKW